MSGETKKDSAYEQAFLPTTPIHAKTEEARNKLKSKRLIFMVDGTRSMGHVVAQVRNLAIEEGAIACMVGISIYYCIYTDYHWDQNRQIGGPLVEGQKYVVLVIDGNRPFTDVERDLNKYYKADIKRNGDNDEAQKTALQYLLQEGYLTGQENTLIVHMTDSLPHEDDIGICIAREGSGNKTKSNGYHENNALNSKEWSHRWVPICEAVKSQATVLTLYEVPEYARESNSNADNKYREIYDKLGLVVPRYLTTEEMSKIILHAFGLAEPSEVIELPQLASLTLKIIQRIVPLSKMISTLEYIILKNPMLLILNPILGFIWRHVCKHRKDPTYEDKITILCNSLSNHTGSSSTLGREDREKLKKFIQDSYSNKDAIVEILQPFCLSGPQRFFVIDGESFISQDDLLAITRGAPKSACRAATALLKAIVTCKGTLTPTRDNCSFIPIRLFEESPSTAFKLLPHLLFPGIEFGLRGAMIMALLSLKNALLRKYAENFLLSCIRRQGYLFDFSFNDSGKPNVPENWSVGFFLNILTEAQDLLDSRTDILLRTEILKIVQKIIRNACASVKCNIGKRPTLFWKNDLGHDHKRQCRLCHQSRSETIFCEGMCGICTCRKQKYGDQYDCMIIAAEFPDKNENQSYMTECSDCAKMYAVRHTKVLTQKPKCFWCRDGVETPPENVNTCTQCKRKLCAPRGSTDGYVCASCEHGDVQVEEYDTSVQDIFRHNNVLDCTPKLFDNILNKSLKDYLRSPEFLELECLLSTLGPHLLDGYEESGASGDGESKRQTKRQSKRQSKHDSMTMFANSGKYEILDPSETMDKLLEALQGNGMGTCSISYVDVPLEQLLCCGNPGCNYPISIDSWISIFSPVQPGHPVHNTNLCCPFCRRKPYYSVVRKHFRNLNGLKGFLDSGINETHWCGWCTECNQIKRMAPRGGDCNAPMPTTTNFKCTDCTHSTRSAILLAAAADANAGDQKPCPNCGIMIVKDDDGERRCWHVECSCGIHFCWKDGECFDNADACYDYMWTTYDSIGY